VPGRALFTCSLLLMTHSLSASPWRRSTARMALNRTRPSPDDARPGRFSHERCCHRRCGGGRSRGERVATSSSVGRSSTRSPIRSPADSDHTGSAPHCTVVPSDARSIRARSGHSLSLTVVICAHTEERWCDLESAVGGIREQTHWVHQMVLVATTTQRCWSLPVGPSSTSRACRTPAIADSLRPETPESPMRRVTSSPSSTTTPSQNGTGPSISSAPTPILPSQASAEWSTPSGADRPRNGSRNSSSGSWAAATSDCRQNRRRFVIPSERT
jgi:hypothetical protein